MHLPWLLKLCTHIISCWPNNSNNSDDDDEHQCRWFINARRTDLWCTSSWDRIDNCGTSWNSWNFRLVTCCNTPKHTILVFVCIVQSWILWHQTICKWHASQTIQRMYCSQPMCHYSSPWRLLDVWGSGIQQTTNLEKQTFFAFSHHRGKMQQLLQMHKVPLY